MSRNNAYEIEENGFKKYVQIYLKPCYYINNLLYNREI